MRVVKVNEAGDTACVNALGREGHCDPEAAVARETGGRAETCTEAEEASSLTHTCSNYTQIYDLIHPHTQPTLAESTLHLSF